MLDYDGTLAPFRAEREKAYPYPGVREALNRILDADNTRLVIVSGRMTREIVSLLSLSRQPEIFGSHGSEHLMQDGTYEVAPLDDKTVLKFAKVDKWIKENGYSSLLEEKPTCRALHLRGIDSEEASFIKEKVLEHWSLVCSDGLLTIHEFDGGIELRIPGRDKGRVVDEVLRETGGEGAFAVYLGDDITDEDAFMAIKGRGVGILVREEARTTHADIWIRPPGEMIEFLSEWEKALRGIR